jgi:RNA polymerase sigma-70 factor (ECF subfamily)
LYSYLRRYTGDRELAEDVFQATFLQVHQKAHLYEEGRPVRPWLYTIATHQAVDAMRKAGRHQAVSLDARSQGGEMDTDALVNLLSAETPRPEDELEEEERRAWVREQIEALPEHLRSVVLLTYYQGLKYREVASILGIPVGTMKSRLHTALGRLSAAWNRRKRAQKG